MIANESYAGLAAASVSMNTYSGFQTISGGSSIVGAVVIMGILGVLFTCPRQLARLLAGYVILGVVGVVLFVGWVCLKSIGPITDMVWFGFFAWVGDLVLSYWTYILASLPLAYLTGHWAEKSGLLKVEP